MTHNAGAEPDRYLVANCSLIGPCDFGNWRDVNAWLSDARPNELDVGNETCLDPFGARALINARLRNRDLSAGEISMTR